MTLVNGIGYLEPRLLDALQARRTLRSHISFAKPGSVGEMLRSMITGDNPGTNITRTGAPEKICIAKANTVCYISQRFNEGRKF